MGNIVLSIVCIAGIFFTLSQAFITFFTKRNKVTRFLTFTLSWLLIIIMEYVFIHVIWDSDFLTIIKIVLTIFSTLFIFTTGISIPYKLLPKKGE